MQLEESIKSPGTLNKPPEQNVCFPKADLPTNMAKPVLDTTRRNS
jgi:hypothetical protein